MMRTFRLPPAVEELVRARNRLREHYASSGLRFTLDGNLLGDLGEAIAAEMFGMRIGGRGVTGIDGVAPDGRTIQAKVTASRRGPAFRMVDTRADHLLFFDLDVEAATGSTVFNGPERVAIERLPGSWVGQRTLTAGQIRAADREVRDEDRLPVVSGSDLAL
ncbi:MAG: hypothetical protein V7704_11150 [Aurantimonas endophytica]|uniref:DUF6998 domain-containing protein n=1 Tax=Aurantimonas endophytica TaxID=1522175 RepID=UPI003001BECD